MGDFERKGTQWLELMRNWILEANQATKFAEQGNFGDIRNFLQGIGSNRRIAAGNLTGEFKMPWHFLAEMPVHARGFAARSSDLDANSIWWRWRESNSRAVRDAYTYLQGVGRSKCLGYASMERPRSREAELSFFKFFYGAIEKPDSMVMTLYSKYRIPVEKTVV